MSTNILFVFFDVTFNSAMNNEVKIETELGNTNTQILNVHLVTYKSAHVHS